MCDLFSISMISLGRGVEMETAVSEIRSTEEAMPIREKDE
jgi:hypothetical protein